MQENTESVIIERKIERFWDTFQGKIIIGVITGVILIIIGGICGIIYSTIFVSIPPQYEMVSAIIAIFISLITIILYYFIENNYLNIRSVPNEIKDEIIKITSRIGNLESSLETTKKSTSTVFKLRKINKPNTSVNSNPINNMDDDASNNITFYEKGNKDDEEGYKAYIFEEYASAMDYFVSAKNNFEQSLDIEKSLKKSKSEADQSLLKSDRPGIHKKIGDEWKNMGSVRLYKGIREIKIKNDDNPEIGNSLVAIQYYINALNEYEEELHQHPEIKDHQDLRMSMGEIYYKIAEIFKNIDTKKNSTTIYEKFCHMAIDAYDAAKKDNIRYNVVAQVKLGKILMETGKYDAAKERFKEAIKENPRSGITYEQLGDCDHRNPNNNDKSNIELNYENAIYYLSQIESASDKDPLLSANLGMLYEKLGDYYKWIAGKFSEANDCYKSAEYCYDKAIRINCKYNTIARIYKGKLNYNLENYNDALKCYINITNINSTDIKAWQDMSIILNNNINNNQKFNEFKEKFKKDIFRDYDEYNNNCQNVIEKDYDEYKKNCQNVIEKDYDEYKKYCNEKIRWLNEYNDRLRNNIVVLLSNYKPSGRMVSIYDNKVDPTKV